MENKKIQDVLEAIDAMSMLEINELIKAIEEKFDVKAAMPAASVADEEKTDAKSSTVSVILKSFGGSKVAVIKATTALLGIKLLEAKKLVESAPTTLKADLSPDEAKDFATKIEEAGGEIEIK